MMPMTMMNSGETASIKKIGGLEKTKQFLESLGFTAGEEIQVVSSNAGNVIVQVKGSRIAVSREAASKIMV